MLRRRALLLAAIACGALVSCGIKGPLRLPPEKPAPSPASAPAAPAPASPESSTTENADAAADKKQ